MVTWLLNSAPVRWAATIFVVVLGVLGALWRRDELVRRDTIREGKVDAHERTQEGRKAVADGRERGSPDERVQHNDHRW